MWNKKSKWNQATIAELFAYGIKFFISNQKINYGFWTLQMETEKKIPNEKTTPLKMIPLTSNWMQNLIRLSRCQLWIVTDYWTFRRCEFWYCFETNWYCFEYVTKKSSKIAPILHNFNPSYTFFLWLFKIIHPLTNYR